MLFIVNKSHNNVKGEKGWFLSTSNDRIYDDYCKINYLHQFNCNFTKVNLLQRQNYTFNIIKNTHLL